MQDKIKNELIINCLITIFLGSLGIHKFLQGKVGLGLLYLFTCGGLGIGWIIDSIISLVKLIEYLTNNSKGKTNTISNLEFTILNLRIENDSLKRQLSENKKIESQMNNIENKKTTLEKEIENLLNEKESLHSELDYIRKDLIIESIKIDDFNNITSQEIKNQLQMLQLSQDEIIKSNKAISILGDVVSNRTLDSNIKQILRSFNIETKSIIDNLTIKNIDSSRTKLQKSFNTLNTIYKIDNVAISPTYYESKLKELTLVFQYLKKLEDEKEQQKAIKEQMIEEEKVRREIEREKLRIDKEESQFKNEVSKLMKYLSSSKNDVEKQLYVDKINELEEKIILLEKDKENINEREQNTRAGYVYIISNIGSFGENIYKIGMTRRLEPMDRIKELSDASVPFQFDVHALIFSDDAPALENTLHQTFKDNQVNKLNPRKEFYNIDLEKIKENVKTNYNNTVNFTDYAEAYEYRESQKILEKLKT